MTKAAVMLQKTHLWLDVDAGVDDAFAIGVVLSRMNLDRSLEVVGVSCVSGNVYAPQVAKNVATILSIFDADPGRPPVVMGAARPLVGPAKELTGWFGRDGLGDVDLAALGIVPGVDIKDPALFAPIPGSAADHLCECALKFGTSLLILALGPLTNIATACGRDAKFAASVGRLVVMGGSTATPEFNFSADPEGAEQAASICLQLFPSTHLLTWECSLAHPLPWGWFRRWTAQTTLSAAFLSAASKQSAAMYASEGYEGYLPCDALAAAVALEPGVVKRRRRVVGRVELEGGRHARGLLVIREETVVGEGNVELIEEVHMEPVLKMLEVSTSKGAKKGVIQNKIQ